MIIIGADYHPGFQQIAFVETETGELQERRLEHREEAKKFYRDLAGRIGFSAASRSRAIWGWCRWRESSGQRRWLGHLTEQGNSLLRCAATGMAEQVLPLGDATRTKDRQGRHGTKTGGTPVLDVAQGMGLRAVERVQFARGTTLTSPWCAVDHREIDWVSPLPFTGSSK